MWKCPKKAKEGFLKNSKISDCESTIEKEMYVRL
jgi:hypothetical protein